jgi:3-oxo-5-alpha-steroid 4-dehydrogenase 1
MEAVFDVILTKEFYYPFLKLWLGIWIVAFILQLFISAPYGRHARSGWGFLLLNSFAFLTMEIVSPIVLDFFFYISPQEKNSMDYLFLLLWNIHYFQRSIIYPLRLQPRKNVSVLVWLFAIFFNIVNGYINGFDLFHLHAHRYSYQDIFTFNFILGFVLFVVGLGINIHSDDILIRLTQMDRNLITRYPMEDCLALFLHLITLERSLNGLDSS